LLFKANEDCCYERDVSGTIDLDGKYIFLKEADGIINPDCYNGCIYSRVGEQFQGLEYCFREKVIYPPVITTCIDQESTTSLTTEATEISPEEAIKAIDIFLQDENLSTDVETLLGDLKTLLTELLSLPGVSSRSDVKDCKNQIAVIKQMLIIYEKIVKIISDVELDPNLPSNVQEFLTKLKSYFSNQIEELSSILKALEKHCNGAVHSIKHQKGKNDTSEPFKGQNTKDVYMGTLYEEVYKGITTELPYAGEPNNKIFVGSQQDFKNIDTQNQQQQRNEVTTAYPFKGTIIEEHYNGNQPAEKHVEVEVEGFRGHNASEAYKGVKDSPTITGFETLEPFKGNRDDIPSIGVIVNYFNI